MEQLLHNIMCECYQYIQNGKVATYIPELAKADASEFGICTVSYNEDIACVGDYKKCFTMQSIVKPIILLIALMDKGEECVRELVGGRGNR